MESKKGINEPFSRPGTKMASYTSSMHMSRTTQTPKNYSRSVMHMNVNNIRKTATSNNNGL